MKLKTYKTDRGFKRCDFRDGNNEPCSIQESSAAEQDMLWLGCDAKVLKRFNGDGTGWSEIPLGLNEHVASRMHLTREQAEALIPLLTKFVKSGHL